MFPKSSGCGTRTHTRKYSILSRARLPIPPNRRSGARGNTKAQKIAIGKSKIADFFSASYVFSILALALRRIQRIVTGVRFSIAISVSALALSACKLVGPNHQIPEVSLPATFTQGGTTWKQSSAPKIYEQSSWWKTFGDSQLTSLAQAADTQNLTLKAAAARLEEARALSRSSRTAVLPSLDFTPYVGRSESRIPGAGATIRRDTVSLPLELSYEVDLWGKVRRQIEGANALEASAQAGYVATKLSLTADTAQTYWALRGLDADRALLQESIALRKETLSLIEARFRAGTVNALDVSRAQTEVATAEAELIGVDRQRSELVNALAVLTGRNAGSLKIPAEAKLPKVPSIPSGIPSNLLLRRPDLFAAERNLAAANANIGVAEAAYYPNFRLRAGGGFDGASMSNLISIDNIVWSLGSSLTYPILGQKNIRAQRDATVARHQALTQEYKQSVLIALREAEDALTGLDFLRRQEDAQNQAIQAAENTLTISRERFSAGLVSFLEVVETERTLLATKRQAASLRTQRLALTVNLIKALGGSW